MNERLYEAMPGPSQGRPVPTVWRSVRVRPASATEGGKHCTHPASQADESGDASMKRDPTLAELMAEWDELARTTPRVDMSVSIREAARMRQRNVERRVDLAKRIAEAVKEEGESDG